MFVRFSRPVLCWIYFYGTWQPCQGLEVEVNSIDATFEIDIPFALSNFNYTIILQKAFQYTFNKFLF